MIVVLVHIHVKPEAVDGFIAASEENARHSVQEAGIARFDFIQQVEDPTRFVLVEAYREREAMARHKESAHYLAWRAAVAEMMAEPRRGVEYDGLWPDDGAW